MSCSWYFHAGGGHSVARYHLIISAQSCCLLQKHLHGHGLQCSCPLSWKDCYSTVSIVWEGPSFIIKPVSRNELQMWIVAKIIFFLRTVMIQYQFQLLKVSVDFDQAVKHLSIFLIAGLCCPYFPL